MPNASMQRASHLSPPGLFSHSPLRTPLTTVLGNASSLLQDDVAWDHDTQDRLLKGIVAESSRLARAVDNILHLASIDAGTLRPNFDWCDPAALLRAVIGEVDQALSPSDRVTLSLSFPDPSGPGGLVWADHVLLGRAVANVVDNALRHNPPATRVALAAAVEDEQLVISVVNDGRALPRNVSAAIADAAANGELPLVIGVGIATTIGLVRAHRGTVSVLVWARRHLLQDRLAARPDQKPRPVGRRLLKGQTSYLPSWASGWKAYTTCCHGRRA